jgi:hypothetical protein
MIHHVRQDAGARDDRLADVRVRAALVEQDAVELDPAADLGFAVIDLNHVSFADTVLPRTVLKHCVHRRLPGPQG